MKRILMIVLITSVAMSLASAQMKSKRRMASAANSLESMLVAKEKQKWEALKTGQFGSLPEMFADDFLSVGYAPDGTVRMTTKAQQTVAGKQQLPPAEFTLSDFKVISANNDSAVVTYRAKGPINLYATSVWAKRGGKWQTIFYQATMAS